MARPILICAGGTGGHLFPAQALAQELKRRGRTAFVITDDRGMRWQDSFEEAPMFRTSSGTTETRGLANRLGGLLKLGLGVLQAWSLVIRRRPGLAIGFGGYPSLPGMLAALACGTRTCVHEQNRVVGRANKLLCPRMNAIALTFPEPKGLSEDDLKKAIVTGNPVRDAVIAMRDTPYPNLSSDGPVNILCFGGSQGATVFSDVVPEAIAALPPDQRSRIRLTQQARSEDVDRVRAAYDQAGMQVEVETFFKDLPERMAKAHLVISRSGASTVCELMVIGRAALLVPLKGALDGDQAANAAFLEQQGGAWMMPEQEFTTDVLTARLSELLANPDMLRAAARNAHKLGRPDAVKALADLVERTEK